MEIIRGPPSVFNCSSFNPGQCIATEKARGCGKTYSLRHHGKFLASWAEVEKCVFHSLCSSQCRSAWSEASVAGSPFWWSTDAQLPTLLKRKREPRLMGAAVTENTHSEAPSNWTDPVKVGGDWQGWNPKFEENGLSKSFSIWGWSWMLASFPEWVTQPKVGDGYFPKPTFALVFPAYSKRNETKPTIHPP